MPAQAGKGWHAGRREESSGEEGLGAGSAGRWKCMPLHTAINFLDIPIHIEAPNTAVQPLHMKVPPTLQLVLPSLAHPGVNRCQQPLIQLPWVRCHHRTHRLQLLLRQRQLPLSRLHGNG